MTTTTRTRSFSPELVWTADAHGSLRSGAYSIRPARVGFQWELWRHTPGLGLEALGCGDQEMLQARAAHFARFSGALKPAEAAPRPSLPQPAARKNLLGRFSEWLNS